jgi:hypothetical protein
MAKKPENTTQTTTFTPEEPDMNSLQDQTQENDYGMPSSMELDGFSGDFNLEEEYKPDPLIPQGTYHGNVTKVIVDPERSAIVWSITLVDNGGVLSDGETPVDGSSINFSNWLPKPGDESVMTATGRSTKRQSKINQLKKFADKNDLDMSTPKAIMEHIQNGDWIGMEVDVTVTLREYEGRVFNDCRDLTIRR